MKQQFSKATLPAIYTGETFEARFESSGGPGGRVSISGLEPEPSQVVSQWIKRIVDKGKQLPSGEAEVIIGSPLFLWGTRECEAANQALVNALTKQPHTRISGIIFHAKHVENSSFLKHVPAVVINPKATARCDEALT
ncbi:MAG: hypothetical protein M1136_04305 [Chloroflexi bacterium]|nr:hypothetical protein [Chloroflexota bacterium]MCL5074862.1 hypothetical protein [Chloroflexota bacterium]